MGCRMAAWDVKGRKRTCGELLRSLGTSRTGGRRLFGTPGVAGTRCRQAFRSHGDAGTRCRQVFRSPDARRTRGRRLFGSLDDASTRCRHVFRSIGRGSSPSGTTEAFETRATCRPAGGHLASRRAGDRALVPPSSAAPKAAEASAAPKAAEMERAAAVPAHAPRGLAVAGRGRSLHGRTSPQTTAPVHCKVTRAPPTRSTPPIGASPAQPGPQLGRRRAPRLSGQPYESHA
jgi:hypothetical protein